MLDWIKWDICVRPQLSGLMSLLHLLWDSDVSCLLCAHSRLVGPFSGSSVEWINYEQQSLARAHLYGAWSRWLRRREPRRRQGSHRPRTRVCWALPASSGSLIVTITFRRSLLARPSFRLRNVKLKISWRDRSLASFHIPKYICFELNIDILVAPEQLSWYYHRSWPLRHVFQVRTQHFCIEGFVHNTSGIVVLGWF